VTPMGVPWLSKCFLSHLLRFYPYVSLTSLIMWLCHPRVILRGKCPLVILFLSPLPRLFCRFPVPPSGDNRLPARVLLHSPSWAIFLYCPLQLEALLALFSQVCIIVCVCINLFPMGQRSCCPAFLGSCISRAHPRGSKTATPSPGLASPGQRWGKPHHPGT
jgi:hypothetical protein